ncbi:putative glycoside hydrolase [Paenibacillus sp. MMS18-CY102]|uniref:putative glycoside hydrolase n=1 Tax=Paenibacillus sp. MMS18-CY102 TaxID=2682849 RepID=UPI0019217866|nr:putative glycoside hydrolase [Paenibacillus sp. MMS18-CY102]
MDILLTTLLVFYNLLTGAGDDSTSAHKLLTAIVQPDAGQGSTSSSGSGTTEEQPSNVFVKKDPQKDAPKVKGIYVTSHSAGGERMAKLLNLLDRTELNSMVIDIKDDYGYITYKTDNAELQKLGTPQRYIKDINATVKQMQDHKIYPIARVVVFKDTVLANKHPELSYRNADGSIWKNGKGDSFVNPYRHEVWDYNVKIAKEAAKLGFKEIQFDYVRFPEGFEKKEANLKFDKTNEKRVDVIADFVKYAREQLEPLGVRVSVDIFGYAASVPAAEGIGQDFVKISKQVDVISPMVYPSHYSTGWFDVKEPDLNPYATIKGAMVDTHKKLEPLGDVYKPVIRPWIQDFTASWLGKGHYKKYGKAEVEAQIKALKDTNIEEYLLWNAGNKYTEDTNF